MEPCFAVGSRRSSTFPSGPRPGTGTSSTWSGFSCSPSFTSCDDAAPNARVLGSRGAPRRPGRGALLPVGGGHHGGSRLLHRAEAAGGGRELAPLVRDRRG